MGSPTCRGYSIMAACGRDSAAGAKEETQPGANGGRGQMVEIHFSKRNSVCL